MTIRRRQHVIVLIKARQVLFLAARNAQRAITKHAFAVNQMTDDFADGPFAFRICIGLLFRRHSAEQNIQIVEFAAQHRHDVALTDLLDITLIIRRVFSFLWPIHF